MTVYSDLENSIGVGFKRTAEEYFNTAKDRFLLRLGDRKPKTPLERNIGEAYANTESGRAARDDYISARLRAVFSNEMNVYLIVGVLFIFALLILRRT